VGQGGKQHVRGPAPWGLAALEPVPLLLGAGWVGDLDRWPAPHARARLTVRTQPSHAKLAGEAHIAQPVAQPSHLVVQGAGPDVRIVGEPGGQVGHERLQRVGRRAAPAGGPLTPHVGTDRLRIAVEMTGDGRDRPSPLAQCVHLHVFSPCEHGAGTPSGCGLAPPASRESHSCWWTSNGQPECSGVGRFSDRVREFPVILIRAATGRSRVLWRVGSWRMPATAMHEPLASSHHVRSRASPIRRSRRSVRRSRRAPRSS